MPNVGGGGPVAMVTMADKITADILKSQKNDFVIIEAKPVKFFCSSFLQ